MRCVVSSLMCCCAIVGTLSSCARGYDGWTQLWRDDWKWYHQGWEWTRGIEARNARLGVRHANSVFRCTVRNLGREPATLALDGPAGARTWALEVGVSNDLEVTLDAGEYTLDAVPGVVLGCPRIGRPRASPRLLVVILVDTLRADHATPRYMPEIAEAFANGAAWHRATANCSWTLPSVASLFTSRPVLDLTAPEGDLIGVPEGVSTWASRLEDAGFIGGAVVANYTVHALNGFAHGFASYLVPDGREHAEHPDATWVVSEARRWLACHRGEDAFLYLHLMDPHQPYRSHSDPEVTAPEVADLALRKRTASDAEEDLLKRLYAEEVRHVDEVVAPFLDELPDSAVVVLTSDHGEALGEHGAWGHGLNLYQEALRVPLAIAGPGVPADEFEGAVQLLDLGPTVLDLMGVETAPGMVGTSLLDGGSAPPIVSSTFGGGPLRWSWIDGHDKVVLRMAAQGDLGARARSAMEERRPLPAGGYYFDLKEDPGEHDPRPIPDDLMDRCGQAFVRSAGRMVPGLQLMVWGRQGAATAAVEVEGEVRVVQAWSVAPMEVVREGVRLEMSCDQSFPVCAVAAAVDPPPSTVRPVAGAAAWSMVEGGARLFVDGLGPPGDSALAPGSYLWWNRARTLVVGAHEETLERLRALGYIE